MRFDPALLSRPRARDVLRAGALIAVGLAVVPAGASAMPSDRAVADAAAKRGPAAPQLQTPASEAAVKAVPAFRWAPVRGAERYEFNLSASRSFESIVHGQGRGSFQTANTWATVNKTLADGDYYWRVRAIDAKDRAGKWSSTRSISKRWGTAPTPEAPIGGAKLTYPNDPLLLRWSRVPGAFKYLVQVATDPSLAQSVITDRAGGVETSGTDFAVQGALAAGTYYWAVTPLDGDKHPGERSAVSSFELRWPSRLNEATELSVSDLDVRPEVLDPQLAWEPIPGAVSYDVEISTAMNREGGGRSFPEDSIVCCGDSATGTSLSPAKLLAHNTGSGVPGDPEQFGYWWRVRGVDPDGNAGEWNYGPPFDNAYPVTLGNLHVRDNVSDVAADLDPATPIVDTSAPILAWQSAPGASSYEVKIVPYVSVSGVEVCNWSAPPSSFNVWDVVTSATAWTPLGNSGTRKPLGVLTNLEVSREVKSLVDGQSYCAQVRARRDRDGFNKEVVSDWTTLGGGTSPAFRYVAPPAPAGSTLKLAAGDYLEPVMGSTQQAAPLLTWKPVDGARGYFVVVARDDDFTKIVDLAFTNTPAYAPRRGAKPWTYPDETTSYWWAVIPTALANGDVASTQVKDNAPQRFLKQSAPPVARDPDGGETVARQPTFRWDPAVGARSYTLQIAQDPSFGDPLISTTTSSTGYTTAATMPADTVLYWRVRANDENNIGLGWSQTQEFRRVLPKVVLDANNPSGGEGIPVFRWAPVQGAVSYDMHVEQVNGTKRDFTFRTTAFTPVLFYGTGIWTWQVRANFKFGGSSVVSGGYSPAIPFGRRISTPTGVHTVKTDRGVVLEWDPATMAKEYRVEVSTSDSFTTIIERTTTGNTSFAPKMLNPGFRTGQQLFWRVASVDEGRNLGGWAARAIQPAKGMRLRLSGSLKRGAARIVRATVTDTKGRVMKGAKVLVTGPGLRVAARRTSASGKVSFRLTPRLAGSVKFQAETAGYRPATKTLKVR